ncbi:AraC family transcriptional regulator [Marinobacterium nitratireducens]|uniref:AraC family transcriptional regulator n=1 Tax=Marinobacterium nitratireducens TaxID=518897 RepID=A0A918DUH5_9GAMM|nr:AraC family transcriptional regulator [Marinobacterium nitratireducens]GGO84499.1 AraC family transcriptional regulator [Marinobacterium nitratireducens]
MTDVIQNMSEITFNPAPTEVYFGRVTYPPGGTHGPRIQRGLEFVHLISGAVEIEVDGNARTLLPGHMALLLPGRHEHFRFHSQQPSEHSWCQFDFDRIPEGFNDRFEALSAQLAITAEMEQLMELGIAMTGSTQVDNHIALIKLGEALLHCYLSLDALPESKRPIPLPRLVREACKYMAGNYQQPLTLKQIADQCHCSVNHLISQFRVSFDTTPMRYLWQLRLNHAEVLLKRTDIAVSTIADQCGFSSPFHFSRLFKERYRQSPRAFRQHVRQPPCCEHDQD